MNKYKPKERSEIRIFIGRQVYTFQRYFEWYFGKNVYAKKADCKLPNLIFRHKTPLMRELKDVDMWLQTNKKHNLKIAIREIDKVMLSPGEVFSYWKLIGKVSKRKGYVNGMVLYYGQVTTGIGGGLCQLSNLIYWMTLHTPLTITERYRHSYDVFPDSNRKQPFGSGATCAYNYLDLQFKNNTQNKYQLLLYLTDTHLVGEWRCDVPATRKYKVYEKDHNITHEVWGGYMRHNIINRRVFNNDGKQIDDQFVTENHAIMMYNPLLTYDKTDIEKR